MTLVLLLMSAAVVSSSVAPPNYEDHIRPIFENACFNCHNPDKQKGDLDLTTFSSAMRGGSGGKFAEPGEGADSKIYGVITHTMKPKMPPKGDKLDKKETELIRAWIDGGLLENKSGKPRKSKKPAFVLKATPSTAKPDGPPPMPEHVLLEPVLTSSRASVVSDMVASPWAPLLAVTGQRQVILYNTDSMEMVGIFPFDEGQPQVLSFHPSGKYLLAGGGVAAKSGTTVTWNIETGKLVLKAGKDYDAVIAASLRPDLGGVSLGGPGKRVKLWSTKTDEQLVSIKKHTDWVTHLAYSPDGVLLASGGRGGDIYIWEADTGNAFHDLRGHKDVITDMAWRSDSNVVATVSEDGQMIIWEMNHGKQVKKLAAHQGGILSVDWNHNGHLVTSGRDKKVKIWKGDFKLLKELPVFSEIVTQVAFSYDGKRVFAADWNGMITAWDVETGTELPTYASGSILVANPPDIASRIKAMQEQKQRFAADLDELENAAHAAKCSWEQTKAALINAEQNHRDAARKHEQLLEERGKLEAEIKSMSSEGESLNKQRQQRQHELARARDELNRHNAALALKRKEYQQKEKELKNLVNEEKRLIKIEQDARKAAEKKTDDVALAKKLADALAKAESELAKHRQVLAKQSKLGEERRLALLQMSEQQKGPGDQLAVADRAWKEVNGKVSVYNARRKELNNQRNALGKPISEQHKLAGQLEKQIKPARESLSKSEAAYTDAAALCQQVVSQKEKLSSDIKRWQLAAINAKAISLSEAAVALAAKQNEDMDAFSELAAAIEKISELVVLGETSQKLDDLRQKIDERAPILYEKQRLASERAEQYRKGLLVQGMKP